MLSYIYISLKRVSWYLSDYNNFLCFGSLCQPLGKGILQRLLLNLCAHSVTRAILIYLLLDMIKPEAEGSGRRAVTLNSQRLYGCHSNTVYGRSQLWDGNCFRLLLNIIFIYLSQNYSLLHGDLSFHFSLQVFLP